MKMSSYYPCSAVLSTTLSTKLMASTALHMKMTLSHRFINLLYVQCFTEIYVLVFQQDSQGLCPAEGTNPATDTGTPTVDPSYQGCDANGITRIFPLQGCKNNCKGGENIQSRSRSNVLNIYFQCNLPWWAEERP